MSSEMNFDATGIAPRTTPDPLPDDKYRSHIVDSGSHKTKDGKGSYLELEFEVLDGEYKGRKFWDRLNLVNSNPKTVEIAQRTLSAICHATGVLKVTNSAQLHYSPLFVRLTIKQDPGYGPSNVVKGYEPDPNNPKAIKAPKSGNTAIGAAQAASMGASAAVAKPVQQAANVPPWAKKSA